MVTTTTGKLINLAQLAAEYGIVVGGANAAAIPLQATGPLDGTALSTITDAVGMGTSDQLSTAIASHVANPNWGLPAWQIDLGSVLSTAQAIYNGTQAFTSQAQRDKWLAGAVLAVGHLLLGK